MHTSTSNEDHASLVKLYDEMSALSDEMRKLNAKLEPKIFALDAMLTKPGTPEEIDTLQAEISALQAEIESKLEVQSALLAVFEPMPLRGNL
jgi:uncharacterized small protein (DUF1192 family)